MSILKTPIRFGSIELANRLVMPPMATAKSLADGSVSDELCAYYDARAKDGAIGMIVVEHAYICPEGQASRAQLSISREEDAEGLARLVSVIRQNGTRAMAQLNHAGSMAQPEITHMQAVSASAVCSPRKNAPETPPMQADALAMQKIVSDFTAAALRAKRAGFDAVEIHSAHGYLLNQFYSPLTNKRADGYGGSLETRLRLHCDVIASVRRAVGADFPIALRLGACDYMEGGSEISDIPRAAAILCEAGIDLLDISGGFCGYTPPDTNEEGYFAALSRAAKQTANVPVLLTGGVVTAQGAEKLLARGDAELIGVGRALFQDADWAANAMREL